MKELLANAKSKNKPSEPIFKNYAWNRKHKHLQGELALIGLLHGELELLVGLGDAEMILTYQVLADGGFNISKIIC